MARGGTENSFGERAADTFYVVDARGRKLRGETRKATVVAALEQVFAARADAAIARLPRVTASLRDVSELTPPRAVPRRRKAR